MASSPVNELAPAPETLNPSQPNPISSINSHTMDCHDSTNQHLPELQSQPSDHPSASDATPGEKRKREDPESDPSLHPLWKTSLCSYFRSQSGSCSHGNTCRYAHGEEELRPRPDNSWDPTSERAKKAAKKSEDGEKYAEEVMMTTDVMVGDEDGDGLDTDLRKCLVHLPRKWRSEDLTRFFGEQGIPFKAVKKKKGMTVGFVNFESEEQLKSAIEGLAEKTIGNKNIKVADVITRSFEKVKSATVLPQNIQKTMENPSASLSSNVATKGDKDENNATPNGSTPSGKSARDVVTPLAHMSYNDQLEHKKSSLMQLLKRLTRNARKACPNGVSLPEWILNSREIGGLPCNLEGILASPIVYGYRNKCEFSVGYSLQGKTTVGFLLGNFREGVTAVDEPVDCPNVSKIACKYASIFQEYLQHSDLPIWNRFKNTGFWRQLTVREGRSPEKTADMENSGAEIAEENSGAEIAEVMLIVQVSTKGFEDEVIANEFENLAHTFVAGAATNSPQLPLTALVVQDHQGISNAAPADAPLHFFPIPKAGCGSKTEDHNGIVEERIHDHICHLKFTISPTAFFQVNTVAAEKLYSLAGDWASLGPDTLVFDICCGTGTIGLTLAHRVGMVVGIEMNASAVSDAHRNAQINGIKNCKFVCAKAEDVMASILKEYLNDFQQQDVIQSASEISDQVDSVAEDKDTSVDNTQDPKGSSSTSHSNKLDSEESKNHELENVKTAAECLDSSVQEPENQLQSTCTSESPDPPKKCFKNVVAIVDPPRGGLHPTVIKALRTHPRLRKLVYISCNPESLVANAIELCTPSAEKAEKGNKNNRGWRNMSCTSLARQRAKSMPISDPFRPVKAMAVDLFPHTVHCEMVMLLER